VLKFIKENKGVLEEVHFIGIDEEITNLFKEALVNG